MDDDKDIHIYFLFMLADCMQELLAWRPGAKAETLRTAAIACLEAACKAGVTSEQMTEGQSRNIHIT